MRQANYFDVVVAVNNEEILAQNLADSPLLQQGVSMRAMRGCVSASVAYNNGIDVAEADVIIFVHQDVYLPKPWLGQLSKAIAAIEETNNSWAVIGVYGVKGDGGHVGHCWSTGLGKVLGGAFMTPVRVVSIDELVIILRKSSGLRFDENLPGFHLYGTDIVQSALASGFSAYVIHAPVVHNSSSVKTLWGAYSAAYRFMQVKWKGRLPIPTTVVPVTRFGYPLLRYKLRRALRKMLRMEMVHTTVPREPGRNIARRLGLEFAIQDRLG